MIHAQATVHSPLPNRGPIWAGAFRIIFSPSPLHTEAADEIFFCSMGIAVENTDVSETFFFLLPVLSKQDKVEPCNKSQISAIPFFLNATPGAAGLGNGP